MTEQPAIDLTTAAKNAIWRDGDPLMEAIAAALWENCHTEGPSSVNDDPRNIAAVAATVARWHGAHAAQELAVAEASIAANEIELEGSDVMLQEMSVGDPIEIDQQTGPLIPGIWVITKFECERRCRARVRRLSAEEIQAARQREATGRMYE